uniref:F-box and WD repeat domain containing 4 n=1 Tax=Salmo trutta TaxID=8032 RepID=A0A674BRR1_SALTR
MFLFQLPDDVLYHIMSCLEYKSLSRLSQVCKTIYHFANRDAVWRKIEKEFINTGIVYIFSRLATDRVKVSQNWSHGFCRKEVMLKWRINLDGEVLYLSQAADIGVYTSLHTHVCYEELLSVSFSDGKILAHHRRNGFSVEYSGHKQKVNCLGCIGGLMVCGSRDRTARIWTLSSNCPRGTVPMNDKVWSVAIMCTCNMSVILGAELNCLCLHLSSFSYFLSISPSSLSLSLRCELLCCLGSEFQRDAGVLDIVYESPFQQLTCGYDTYIRSWDLRLSPRKCVMEWEEPHDSALYCIQTDGNHMIASGSSYYVSPAKHPHTITPPPPCFTVGTTHAEIICSPTLHLTKTRWLEPNISNLDSSEQRTDFHLSNAHCSCFLAHASLFFLLVSFSSGFFAAVQP